ncbi:MAG: prenyltransferase [Lentisphaerota bacterium]
MTVSWRDEFKLWIRAIRFYTHTASVLPVVVGSSYAWLVTGRFRWDVFLAAMVAGALYQSGCNLINDFFDFKYGLDREGTYGGSGVLPRKEMTPRKMAAGIVVLLALGSLLGLWLAWTCGWIILWLGLGGLFSLVFYTATPHSAKYSALGEPLVFLSMGVAMTLGGYAIQTGDISWNAVWISLPLSFLVTAILQANDMRDLADDRLGGIKTISIGVGPLGARAFYSALIFGAFISMAALVWSGIAPWPVLLSFLTLPMAIQIHRTIWRHRGEKEFALKDAPVEAAKLHLAFNTLMVIGLVLGKCID